MPDEQAPRPVRRYLRRALGTTTTPITGARFHQRGELRTDARSRAWHRFCAEETVDPVNVQLAWNARVRIAPLIRMTVEDRYGNGEGSGRVALFSMITLSSERGSAALNEASLLRFLAEAPGTRPCWPLRPSYAGGHSTTRAPSPRSPIMVVLSNSSSASIAQVMWRPCIAARGRVAAVRAT